jgi:hypothetical protein
MSLDAPLASQPRRVGALTSIAALLGCDPDGAPRRPIVTIRYAPPTLPWDERNRWLRKVRRLISECKEKKESFPHKAESVARAIAELGDVCKASIDYIARKAGCVEGTVKACIAWLEGKGALTWSNTRGKDKSGRIVRQANLYRLITDFAGATAVIARTMRAIWRERPRIVSVPKDSECPGIHQPLTYLDPYDARKALKSASEVMEARMLERWKAERAERATKWNARYAT